MIEEIEVDGIRYRGVMPAYSTRHPWRINALLPSDKIGTSGQPVGSSWQLWRKYDTETKARADFDELKQRARHRHEG